MKKIIGILVLLAAVSFGCNSQKKNGTTVIIKTDKGDLTVKLYDNTPMHKENFLKLVKENFYDGVLFHRVIPEFMIQTGDPDSKGAKPGQALGRGGPGYTIPAEFIPENFHKKGALAAARQGDQVNPKKESSGSQFYIVMGKKYLLPELAQFESRMGIKFSEAQRQAYTTVGGTPHLDYNYTVFGEVIEGLEIIDIIANAQRDRRDRPVEDIKIIDIIIK